MIFLLLTRYKVSKFLTRQCCRGIFREATTSGQPDSGKSGPLVPSVDRRRPVQWCVRFPRQAARLEQVSIRSNLQDLWRRDRKH